MVWVKAMERKSQDSEDEAPADVVQMMPDRATDFKTIKKTPLMLV